MEGQESESGSLGSSESLSSAVEAISSVAPTLPQPTGLDKLKAAKEHVEKTGELPKKPGETVPAATPAAPAAAGEKPAYTPDFKYKASGKEMEIPEKFRALITDKESEEEVKKLFGQAATLDEFKGENAKVKENLHKVGTELNRYNEGIGKLRQMVQKNDFDSFFKGMNIPEEKIYKWVLDKVNYNQLPPEQRAQIDHQRNLERQTEMAQSNLGQASLREQQLAVQLKTMQFEHAMGTPHVKSIADSYDARVGKPGAFSNAVIEHGKSVWALTGQDLTPEQAVTDFVQKYGITSLLQGQAPAAGAASPPSANAAPAASAPATPPVKVIPNVAGRSASPIKKGPRSIEDLNRLKKEAIERDNAQRVPSSGYLAS